MGEEKAEYDLNDALITSSNGSPNWGDVVVLKNDLKINGNISAYNIGNDWSMVEYLTRIVEAQEDVEGQLRLKVNMGIITSPLDSAMLTTSLNSNLSNRCLPVRAFVTGFTHDVFEDENGVWSAITFAQLVIRPVGIEDLANG